MLYKNTQYNLMMLMRDIGYAYPQQLLRFFSDAPDAKNLPYYLKKQIDERNFFWAAAGSGTPMDPDAVVTKPTSFKATHSNILMFRKTPELKPDSLSMRLRALWVLASFPSGEVRQIYLANYPAQLMFITTDNQCYEITVVNSTTTAQVAMQNRERGIPKGMQDEVNHIALVNSPDFGLTLEPYGFDSFCFLNDNYYPEYGVWD